MRSVTLKRDIVFALPSGPAGEKVIKLLATLLPFRWFQVPIRLIVSTFFPGESNITQAVKWSVARAQAVGDGIAAEAKEILETWKDPVLEDHYFWLKLSVSELAINVGLHDQLDVHGRKVALLLEGANKSKLKARLLRAKAKAAKGLRSKLALTLSQSDDGLSFRLTISLSRPFDEFPKLWAKAKARDIQPSELETTSGRGLLLAGNFFDEASYDQAERRLVFVKRA